MKYLFVFGYKTPRQVTHRWDDEDSCAVFIEADSEDAALRWGREVARNYVGWLFTSLGGPSDYTWKAEAYANWIEPTPPTRFSAGDLASIPTVPAGTIPDFGTNAYFRRSVA